MKRKIYTQLMAWKEDGAGRTALLVDGARSVGKSYIVEQFARAEYRSYILIDFSRVSDDVKDLFEHYLNDLDTLFLYLANYYNVKLYERESLIIFDDVQLCPRARAAIKYLVADGRYDYIETGCSFTVLNRSAKDIVIPSEERHIKMYPMDFEEFLWAMGNATLMGIVRTHYEARKPLGQAMHRKAMDYFRQYLIVGGMPEAVSEYIQSRDFDRVDQVKREILTLYREDIGKHADGLAAKVTAIFDAIPLQLNKREKKFKLSCLKQGARFRDYEDALCWLSDSMMINVCYYHTDLNDPMALKNYLSFKCFMGDTGLLISHAFDESQLVNEEIYRKLLFDKLDTSWGMVAENIVAQMLAASEHRLYFYSNSSREDKDARMEIDFLIPKRGIGNQHIFSPIEVKSSRYYTLSSLRKFIKEFHEQTATPYILHTGDVKEEGGLVFLPLYMAPLL